MATTTFRTCPDTGLKFFNSTENLLKANAVAAVVFLLVGGLHGLLVGRQFTCWAQKISTWCSLPTASTY